MYMNVYGGSSIIMEGSVTEMNGVFPIFTVDMAYIRLLYYQNKKSDRLCVSIFF